METEPAESHDSAAPPSSPESTGDEPVPAVSTRETTPVWAQTSPLEPPEIGEAAAPAVPMQKGDPDWTKDGSGTDGDGPKAAPVWAETVPTDPAQPVLEAETTLEVEPPHEADHPTQVEGGEPTAAPMTEPVTEPVTEPPKAVAADAMRSTWPPAAESAAAPPQETDIWPPEPPTERAMPAWPPSSELPGHAQGAPGEIEEPATPAQAIPSWPDSFDAVAPATPAPSTTAAAAIEPSETDTTPPTITPRSRVEPVEPVAPAAEKPATPTTQAAAAHGEGAVPRAAEPQVPATAPPAASQPPPAVAPAASEPVEPAQAAPMRPAWAPHVDSEPARDTASSSPVPPLQVPSWAPRVPLAAEPGTPTWFSPKEAIPHATAQPIPPPAPAPAPRPASMPPVAGGQLPVAPIPAPQPAPAPPTAKPTWEVVQQQSKVQKGPQGPTPEDRSYAEWFAWAKRGGAPASACHAAAQGAFKALASGKDVTTAVQWATAAMSRPPENVSYARQTYCAWFSLANIDLNLDQHRSHAFANAAVQALDAGQDAGAAHAAGLAAAGIR